MNLKILLRAMRAPFLVASAIPVIFAATLAANAVDHFDWIGFLLALIGIVLVHAAANMSNDYFDYHNKTDIINRHRTIFSGGSGVLVEGGMSLKTHKAVFLSFYAIAFFIGLFLAFRMGNRGWIVGGLAVVSFFLTYCYSCPPLNLAHRGLGELIVGLCFGPLPVVGTYFILTGNLSLSAALASIPIMALIIAVLWINEFPDVEADASVNKRNLVIKSTPSLARYGYYALIFAAYSSILILSLTGLLPVYSLAALLTIPVAIKSSLVLHRNFDDPKGVFPAMGLTILDHHLVGLILIGSLIFEKFAG